MKEMEVAPKVNKRQAPLMNLSWTWPITLTCMKI